MKRALLIAAALASILVAPTPPAHAAAASAGYHWYNTTNGEVTVKFLSKVESIWDRGVSHAAKVWTESDKVNATVVDKAPDSSCGLARGKVNICSGHYSGGWAGLTEVTYTVSGHVLTARMRLNDSTPSTARIAVACHEMGHAFGLAHNDPGDTTSCMTPTVTSAQKNPDNSNYNKLDQIYQHQPDGATRAPSGNDGVYSSSQETFVHDGLITVVEAVYVAR